MYERGGEMSTETGILRRRSACGQAPDPDRWNAIYLCNIVYVIVVLEWQLFVFDQGKVACFELEGVTIAGPLVAMCHGIL